MSQFEVEELKSRYFLYFTREIMGGKGDVESNSFLSSEVLLASAHQTQVILNLWVLVALSAAVGNLPW